MLSIFVLHPEPVGQQCYINFLHIENIIKPALKPIYVFGISFGYHELCTVDLLTSNSKTEKCKQ